MYLILAILYQIYGCIIDNVCSAAAGMNCVDRTGRMRPCRSLRNISPIESVKYEKRRRKWDHNLYHDIEDKATDSSRFSARYQRFFFNQKIIIISSDAAISLTDEDEQEVMSP